MAGIAFDAGFSLPGFPTNRIENPYVSASEDPPSDKKTGAA
jgi:hypothetical protein